MLKVEGLAKRFGSVPVFGQVSFELGAGEFVALVGESGVGKSTLLNCLAGLEPFDEGSVHLHGRSLAGMADDELSRLRSEQLGFVFQAFHVLPHLSVAENVQLPLRLLNRPFEQAAAQVLQRVGLADLAQRMPGQLSGGQLQRVALARAVVHAPALILADEPTGNLDPRTAATVMQLLADAVAHTGAACLLVTHSPAAAAHAQRRLQLTPTGVVAG